VISEPNERYEAYCSSSDFIREHIFPGGHLPSMGAMLDAARGTGLQVGASLLPPMVLVAHMCLCSAGAQRSRVQTKC
jgi:Mycolic acid cyclopropane synthetase